MSTIIAIPVTSQGVLVPHSLIVPWGSIEQVQIERRSDAIIIKPQTRRTDQLRAQIISQMKASGLVEELPWAEPPAVSPEERARLAKKLSNSKPLSEIILEDREDHV